MNTGVRQRSTLPSISRLEMPASAPLKREEADIQAAEAIISMAPQHSAKVHVPYPGPPPPYTAAPHSAHTSPIDATDPCRDATAMRQSLPSISEALGHPQPPQPFERERSPPRPYLRRSASPRSTRYSTDYDAPHHSHRHTLSGGREASPRQHHAAPRPAPYVPPLATPSPTSPRSRATGQWSMPPPPPPPQVAPTSYSAQPSPRSPAWSHPQPPHHPSMPPSSSFAAQPYYALHYDEQRAQHAQPTQFVTSYPTLATSTLTGPHEAPWNLQREKPLDPGKRPMTHSDVVKSHLAKFDMEAHLGEIYDASYNLMQFSQTYKTRAHQANGVEPTADDVREAMKFNQRTHDALGSLLQRLEAQEAERAAERSAKEAMEQREKQKQKEKQQQQQQQQQAHQERMEEQTSASAGTGERRESGAAAPDGKKRRGRAAPPGRCHSCNRAETPEWRRGPDGARTLCNACGLHYAKLTRKMGTNKEGAGSSGLRQKPMTSS